MNMTGRCEETECFANSCYHCRVLTEPSDKYPCPFFKTREQLKEERRNSIFRLQKIRRTDLIESYILAFRKKYEL